MNRNNPPTEHILACLSSSPSNAKIVRTAATMAKAFGGSFTALYVKTPDADWMSAQDKQRLQQHIHMAEQAGADITTLYGDDISQQIAEFARISGITKIVLGRSSVHRRHFWSGPSLTEKLTLTAPNLDIYIIPDAAVEQDYGSGRRLFARSIVPSFRDLLITAGILACITVIGFLFLQLDFARYNIIMFYMLGVLLTALTTSGYSCGVLGSIASVALYNFFLTEPRLTFHAYDPGYQITFVLMLTSAIVTCTLTTRLKDQAKMSAQAAFRTKVLFDTSRLLQKATNEDEILSLTAAQLTKLLNRNLIVYPEQDGSLGQGQILTQWKKAADSVLILRRNAVPRSGALQIRSVRVHRRITAPMQKDCTLRFVQAAVCLVLSASTCRNAPWMRLKTASCCRSLVNAHWQWKTVALRWKRSKPLFMHRMNSFGQICCEPFPMIFGRR